MMDTISPKQAASLIGVTEGTLKQWRSHQQRMRDLPYFDYPSGIKYSLTDVHDWRRKNGLLRGYVKVTKCIEDQKSEIDIDDLDVYISSREASIILEVSVSTLEQWRGNPKRLRDLPFYNHPSGIRYRRSEIQAWLRGLRKVPEPKQSTRGGVTND